MSASDPTDVYLPQVDAARRVGVSPERITIWARTYGPDHEVAWPGHREPTGLTFAGRRYVLASALDAWVPAMTAWLRDRGRTGGMSTRGRRRTRRQIEPEETQR